MANQEEKKSRCVDIVFCIDGTGSMTECINAVKDHAENFHSMLMEKMVRMGSDVAETRIKVVVFRDYGYDRDNSMQISDFFALDDDDDVDEYKEFLANVRAQGGGDGPENGLEALFYAMQSKFETGDNDRQVIVLFTDADALDLGNRKDSGYYPTDMVDETTLAKMWAGVDQERATYLNQLTKRLVIFAPSGSKYENITKSWDMAWFKPVEGENGLKDVKFDEIIELLAKSASAKARKN